MQCNRHVRAHAQTDTWVNMRTRKHTQAHIRTCTHTHIHTQCGRADRKCLCQASLGGAAEKLHNAPDRGKDGSGRIMGWSWKHIVPHKTHSALFSSSPRKDEAVRLPLATSNQ